MFFDLSLLKRGNTFSVSWIAGTRGIKHVTVKDIKEINVSIQCDEIMKYLVSNSLNPRNRISLRLATYLTVGCIAVFKKKVIMLSEDVSREIVCLFNPVKYNINTASTDDTFPTPKVLPAKKRAKRTPRAVNALPFWEDLERQAEIALTEEQLEEILNVRQAASHEITLPDEQPLVSSGLQEPDHESIRALFDDFQISIPLPEAEPEAVTPGARMPLLSSPRKRRLASENSSDRLSLPTKIRIQQTVHVDVHEMDGVKPLQWEEPMEITHSIYAPPVQLEAPIIQEEVIHIGTMADQVVPATTPRKKAKMTDKEDENEVEIDRKLLKKLLKIRKRKTVKIDCRETVSDAPIVSCTQRFPMKVEFKTKNLIDLHLAGESFADIESQVRDVTLPESVRENVSAFMRLPEKQRTPVESMVEGVLVPMTPEAEMITSTPQTHFKTIAAAAAEKPKKKSEIDDISGFHEKIQEVAPKVSVELVHQVGELMQEEQPPRMFALPTRQQNIVDYILRKDKNRQFKIEELAEQPINVLNAATCFGDLIALSNAKYLDLYPEEGSVKFAYVMRGPKLIN